MSVYLRHVALKMKQNTSKTIRVKYGIKLYAGIKTTIVNR